MKAIFSLCLAAMFLLACGSNSNETVTSPSQNTSSERPLNPPHGMPGHTCAVPDGAPLPETGTVLPESQNNAPVQMEAQNLPGGAANSTLKVNPAHGLPGHRCDIAVGAPL